MRCAATIVALLLAAGGCASASPDPSPAAEAEAEAEDLPEAPPSGSFVVLRAGTRLFRRPSDEAPSFVFAPQQSTSFDDFRSFEVVGRQGHWIRIRNVPDTMPKRHCARGWEDLNHFAIELWVREVDVQRVTVKPVFAEFDDGTSVMLAAGTPVDPHDAEQWTALGLGASARLPLRRADVGTSYRPGALYAPDGSFMDADTKLELGGIPIDTRPLMHGRSIRGDEDVRRDDGTLVTVGTRCAELKVLARGEKVPPEVVESEMEARTAAAADVEPFEGRWLFEAGAEVFWRDGQPAGKLVEAHAFHSPPSVDSDRRCFEHAGTTLCLRADAMTFTNVAAE